MKTRIKMGLAAICFLSLTSCSKYYISTISSTNMPRNEKTGEFQLENDTVKIFYSFAGESAPVKVTVHNKLSVPLYVDWAKSSLIYQGKALSYIPQQMAFAADLSLISANGSYLSFANGDIKGQLESPKDIAFIPPNTSIETTTLFLNTPIFMGFSDSLYKEKEMLNSANGLTKVKSGNFTKSNSPLIFRSYLTLFSKEGDLVKPFAFDQEFYVSKSVRTYVKPQNLTDYSENNLNVFYISKKTKYGKIMGPVAVIGVIAGAAAIAEVVDQK
ncbi:hypothetical protein D3C87_148580 [compost metagenome]